MTVAVAAAILVGCAAGVPASTIVRRGQAIRDLLHVAPVAEPGAHLVLREACGARNDRDLPRRRPPVVPQPLGENALLPRREHLARPARGGCLGRWRPSASLVHWRAHSGRAPAARGAARV